MMAVIRLKMNITLRLGFDFCDYNYFLSRRSKENPRYRQFRAGDFYL
jgi:hypothetical protein